MKLARLLVSVLAMTCLSFVDTPFAQQPTKFTVGVLVNSGPGPRYDGVRDQLLKDLAALGYVDTIRIEPRFAHDRLEAFPKLTEELVAAKVDVIFAVGGVPAAAAMKVTSSIPIVYIIVTDPVAVGLAQSYERPGGNATGVTSLDPEQPKKQIALLREVIPQLKRLAVISDSTLPGADARGWAPLDRDIDAAAGAAGVGAFILKLKGPDPDLAGAFATIKKDGADAVLVLETPIALSHRKQIIEMATELRLATLYPPRPADPSSVLIYGVNFGDVYKYVPGYIDKILKGAKAGDLPITVLKRYEFVVNAKTARAIGLTIPAEVLKRADKVVE